MTRQLIFLTALALIAQSAGAFTIAETDGAITITRGDKTVLVYHKAEVPPPAGADPIYRRSGFIHPLCAPSGAPVTGIHPADHVHHLGLWHAWVKTEHGDRQPDFWNLKTRTGRVRFKETVSTYKVSSSPGFSVRQEHVSYADGKDPVVVLDELFSILVRELGGDYYIDYTVSQKNVTDAPLKLPAYRYGGPIAYRAPAHWDKTNSTVLTSEGKTRADGHTSRGRWCAFSGPLKGGGATVAILCHPDNHDAPQRMRIWPADTHDGQVFFNYVPIQETSWEIAPGESADMRYRIRVSDEPKTDPKKIDVAWQLYVAERPMPRRWRHFHPRKPAPLPRPKE